MKLWQLAVLAIVLLAGLGAAGVSSPPPDNANQYVLFIHGGGGDEKGMARVVSALAQRYYVVRPPDQQSDDVGGAGVDYFAESDKNIAQDIADVVNAVLYNGEPKVHPRFQRIKNPTGYIGVWLYSKN
jgi:predicted esterase